MTSQLEVYQRGLVDLIKCRGSFPDEPYLRSLIGSRELAMLREIAVWWRAFQIEAQCRFVSRLLKRLNCFDQTVETYFIHNWTSPFIEELSCDFLHSLHEHPDALVRSVSRFECAIIHIRAGSGEETEILWDRHPDLVFVALESGGEIPPEEPGYVYRMKIARNLPGLVSCSCEFAA
jgi:hypothetical protein